MVTWNVDPPPPTDFNINECDFPDEFFKLDNLLFEEQHLLVSFVKNVWDKNES